MHETTASAAADGVRPRRSLHSGVLRSALSASFYLRPAEEVARDLLGGHLVSEVGGVRCVAEIVETEAYVGPHDAASHAHERIGRTYRNAMMFGPPGVAYVYRIYGIHWCLNVVTGPEGYPAAVLIRAARPLHGIETARERRPARQDTELMRGPGNLARALGVDGSLNGHALAGPPLWLEPGEPFPESRVRCGPRIGVSRAADLPLRFWVDASRWVSRTR